VISWRAGINQKEGGDQLGVFPLKNKELRRVGFKALGVKTRFVEGGETHMRNMSRTVAIKAEG